MRLVTRMTNHSSFCYKLFSLSNNTLNLGFKGKIELDITSNNEYIVIKLSDNGTGIKDTKKIMTPYFTTKKNGTGLGLPIVKKIITEHSGDLIINNKEEGTVVAISLPTLNEK